LKDATKSSAARLFAYAKGVTPKLTYSFEHSGQTVRCGALLGLTFLVLLFTTGTH
jgi:hypothetical protein